MLSGATRSPGTCEAAPSQIRTMRSAGNRAVRPASYSPERWVCFVGRANEHDWPSAGHTAEWSQRYSRTTWQPIAGRVRAGAQQRTGRLTRPNRASCMNITRRGLVVPAARSSAVRASGRPQRFA